ncbi:MAG TPA: rubrerythrin family protein [Terriglobales bacterium]|nr:rubrerythrin family protein [Terriglobales bacterium]
MQSNRVFSIVLLFSFLTLTAVAFAADPGTTATLTNLQAAFNGESNAHARYLAFAKKADAEGYGEVASLFRAAAKAEDIHANNHAAVIRKLGGKPEAKIETPDVKTTKENLEAAIKGESYERDTMYPQFLKQAREVRNTDAIQTFNFAKTAEAEHAKLYTAALKNLDKSKGTKAKNFYVCGICGYTVEKVDFAKCPSCFSPKEKYEVVS